MESADMRQCSLLLFVATSSEEEALKHAAAARRIPFERIRDKSILGEYYWMGRVGDERVIAVRARGMGPLGRGGSADLALRFQQQTAATAIVQVGMAFGIAAQSKKQQYGDVLVSSSLIPYDNRDIKPAPRPSSSDRMITRVGRCLQAIISTCTGASPAMEARYVVDYERATWQDASPVLVSLFQREQQRGGHSFAVHVGALLSGAARIHTRIFRDELVNKVPQGEGPIVGGEMEAVGLLGAADKPIWCVVKGIVDFADENRDAVYKQYRPIACRNAAEFVLSALVNDARR